MSQSKDRNAVEFLKEQVLQKFEQSLKNLRIADVELFVTAAHMKNLGKSAIFHHLSQSAASTAIQRVESAFGVSLCTHEKRQFSLTRQGQILFPRLEAWLKQLKDLLPLQNQAPIRLVATHAIAQVTVPALLAMSNIEFTCMRPDEAYAAILRDEADIALVLDNAPWKGVMATEIGQGSFQLYSSEKEVDLQPVFLPEDQIEVLALLHGWQQAYGYPIPVRSRIPSWSLIANICSQSKEVGFLPDFLAKKLKLYPVSWQPPASTYRVLAIYRSTGKSLQGRLDPVLHELRKVFE